jgi:glycosyltransferase involved in cell wall biosynthesis
MASFPPSSPASSPKRIVWLFPSLWLGHYWRPVLAAFHKLYPNTTIFTGELWDDFEADRPGASIIRQVGTTREIRYAKRQGYSHQLILPSLGIVAALWRARPDTVLSHYFSLWSLLATLLKPLGRWRTLIFLDGSSPNVDFRDSRFRTSARRFIAARTDAFVTNSNGAKAYLTDVLGVAPHRITTLRYLVPEVSEMQVGSRSERPPSATVTFLYVGKLIPRKGIHHLLEACWHLVSQGYTFRLTVVGDGSERKHLEIRATEMRLHPYIEWVGWVDNRELGRYYAAADAFIFPTLEDVWGMVALEALAFGKPVICSRHAGAAELIEEGENGWVVEPRNPEEMAQAMRAILTQPERLEHLSVRAKYSVAPHTPSAAASGFAQAISRLERAITTP